MTGWQPGLSEVARASLVFLLVFSNLGLIIHLYNTRHINTDIFKHEIWKFMLLMLLFFTTPLMVGFGIYFVLWHSLSSMGHQIEVIRTSHPNFGIASYLKQALPLSIMAFGGLGFLYFFFGHLFNEGQNLGVLFLFVSIITVPHTALMEWLYRVGKPTLTQKDVEKRHRVDLKVIN